MNSLDALGFVVWMVGGIWLVTGCAIWLRWGWCGVRWIWRHSREIDQAIVHDVDGCRFHAAGASSPATDAAPEGRSA